MAKGDITTKAQVLDRDFVPSRRGRKPMVDVGPVRALVEEKQPNWVLFDMPIAAEANSMLRQLSKLAGYETASETLPEGGKKVYVRFKPGRRL